MRKANKTFATRRCLSYLTIELKGDTPEEFRPALAEAGNRIYGCDICQEVCPFNARRSMPTTEPAFQSRTVTNNPKLVDLLLMGEEEFRIKFKGSPVKRAKRRGLLRNVAIALAASDDPEATVALEQAAEHDPEPIVREHDSGSVRDCRRNKRSSPRRRTACPCGSDFSRPSNAERLFTRRSFRGSGSFV